MGTDFKVPKGFFAARLAIEHRRCNPLNLPEWYAYVPHPVSAFVAFLPRSWLNVSCFVTTGGLPWMFGLQ